MGEGEVVGEHGPLRSQGVNVGRAGVVDYVGESVVLVDDDDDVVRPRDGTGVRQQAPAFQEFDELLVRTAIGQKQSPRKYWIQRAAPAVCLTASLRSDQGESERRLRVKVATVGARLL